MPMLLSKPSRTPQSLLLINIYPLSPRIPLPAALLRSQRPPRLFDFASPCGAAHRSRPTPLCRLYACISGVFCFFFVTSTLIFVLGLVFASFSRAKRMFSDIKCALFPLRSRASFHVFATSTLIFVWGFIFVSFITTILYTLHIHV